MKRFVIWVALLQRECNIQGFSNQPVNGFVTPITLAGCPTVKRGACGNITAIIQARLTDLLFDVNIDGIFGDNTFAAVQAFQKFNGLIVDGIVGPQTWARLLGIIDNVDTTVK